MRSKLLTGFFSLALALTASGQTAAFYINDGLVNCPPQYPPQIDATNFVNNNLFNINFTNIYITLPIFDTSNTRNFTNRGRMLANTGFRLDNGPANSGQRRLAESIFNPGIISAGSAGGQYGTYIGGSKLYMYATNIIQTGTNIVGVDGLLKMGGKKIDLSRGSLRMEGYDGFSSLFNGFFGFLNTVGVFDQYWGIGTNTFLPAANFGQNLVVTPPHIVTTLQDGAYFNIAQALAIISPQVYVNTTAEGTNLFVQVAYVGNTNAAINNRVFLQTGGQAWDIAVEWSFNATNAYTGIVQTNYLNLLDSFGVRANFGLVTNAFTGLFTPTARPTEIPENYSLFQGQFFSPAQPSAGPGIVAGLFQGLATNEWTAYSALLSPTTQLTNNVIGQYVTNLPGRIEITADRELSLNRTRIDALNYLLLKSTNHFVDSARSSIISPFTDVILGSTNGSLTISNLVIPTVPRFTGDVDVWSGRWTNADLGVRYHVLVVDSHLDRKGPAYIQDLSLRSTNVIVADLMNLSRSLLVEAENLTITTNLNDTVTSRGDLNILSESIIWSSSTPRLKNLTNNGAIRALNAMYFGGSRRSPFFSSDFDEPYLSMINRGEIFNEGMLLWANYFENSGLLSAGVGSITIQAMTAGLTNGLLIANSGDITITSDSLVVTNSVLQAGRAITLSATNVLTDTGTNTANTWRSGLGINLLHKPAQGDLRGTTLFSTLTPFAEAVNVWAGEDRGPIKEGFTNNVAIGQLILDGGGESQFTFRGAGPKNALYVDYLELRNFITNINANGNLSALNVESNMVVYYAQAVAGGVSVAERLDFSNDGRMRWVPGYAGFNSLTNVVYPDGSTNALNAALVLSQNLDSDGDGIPNVIDPTPVFLVTTARLPDATNSTPYSVPLIAFGGPVAAPYSWALAPGSALPPGFSLSPAGVVSGTPTEMGEFTFTVRASVTTPGGVLTADRELSLTVQASTLALALAVESGFAPSARVSWVTAPNSTNYVYFRSSLTAGNWQLLTNFVSSSGGAVSIRDPVGNNQTRSYRVQVDSPKP